MNQAGELIIPGGARTFIGLGSNIAPREHYLGAAVDALRRLGEIVRLSSVYETVPVGGVPQADYLNAALELYTRLSAPDLIGRLKELERGLGRIDRPRWHEREIDLDLLFYGELTLDLPELRVPHPEIAHRAFVLVPMAEIAPEFRHPLLQTTMRDLRNAIDIDGINAVDFSL